MYLSTDVHYTTWHLFPFAIGQMVLFTSPEDMILGQPVVLQHRKEVTSTAAANKLKTINRLVSSSLGYQPDKVSLLSQGLGQ